MKIRLFVKKLLAMAAVAVIWSSVVAADEPATFVIADAGKAQAVIVIDKDAKPGVKYAAKELADFLGRLSGATFMVADKPVKGYKSILVGTPYKPKELDEICVRVKNENTLEVTGDRSRGTLYAAYDLLEYFGVVFCARDYDFVPRVARLELPADYNKVDAPFMYAERSSWSDTGWHDFASSMKLRLLVHKGLATKAGYPDLARDYETDYNHAIPYRWLSTKVCPEAKNHPEWFAYVRAKDPRNYNGESGGGVTAGVADEVARKARNYNWVCISNEEMWKVLLAGIEATLAKDPTRRELSVAIGDCADYCECNDCLKLVAKYPDPDGSLIPSVQTYILANRIAKHFAKKYPNVRFNMLPYGDRHPKNFPLEPNVGGSSAELWRNHCLPADNNERSAFSLATFCGNVTNPKNGTYIWEYLANFSDWMIPYPNMYIMGGSMRYYKRLGVRGVSTQHQFSGLGDLSEMKLWVHAKLHWNPDYDVDKLINTYVNAAYGPAAKYIREYVDIVEHARLRQRWTWYGCYVPDTSHYLSDVDCVRIYNALSRAHSSVRKDPRYLPRVLRAKIPAVGLAIWRYRDMKAPAAAMKVNLPSLKSLYYEWHALANDSSTARYHHWYAEGGADYGKRITNMFGADLSPTNYTPQSVVISVPASKLTGGKRMIKGRDKDGTEYARISISLKGEPESIWMNPNFAEIGYEIPQDQTGDWYVFATVRLGTTVDGDPSAAYMGIYQKWYPNGILVNRSMEVANQAIVGRLEEKGVWKTICLGKRRLFPKSRIWVMPGILHPCEYIDVKDITLVSPRLFERTVTK